MNAPPATNEDRNPSQPPARTPADPREHPESAPPSLRKRPLVLALASSLLAACAFPPLEWSWVVWFAMAPLFALARLPLPAWRVALAAFAAGMLFWIISIAWVNNADPTVFPGYLLMCAALAFWWPVAILLARRADRALGVPPFWTLPVLWVALEYVRAHAFTGFPWYYLAHALYQQLPLVQIADFAGALALTWVVAVVNALWPELLDPRPGDTLRRALARSAFAAALVLATLLYGAHRLSTSEFHPGPELALIQSDFPQSFEASRERDPNEVLARMVQLTNRAAAHTPPPDLVVWPETSFPFTVMTADPALDDARLAQITRGHPSNQSPAEWRESMSIINRYLRLVADNARVPVLVGATAYRFTPAKLLKTNAAVLVRPGVKHFEMYHKLHLVPFGEYVPLLDAIPALASLTPYRGTYVPTLDFGERPVWFEIDGNRVAVAICFEDTLPHVVRRLIADTPDAEPVEILLNMSNDGWFRDTPANRAHLAFSVFRAVEHRTPLARAANTGISALVDADGRILQQAPPSVETILQVQVPLDARTAPYTRWGDWFGKLASALALALAFATLRANRRQARNPETETETETDPDPDPESESAIPARN